VANDPLFLTQALAQIAKSDGLQFYSKSPAVPRSVAAGVHGVVAEPKAPSCATELTLTTYTVGPSFERSARDYVRR